MELKPVIFVNVTIMKLINFWSCEFVNHTITSN